MRNSDYQHSGLTALEDEIMSMWETGSSIQTIASVLGRNIATVRKTVSLYADSSREDYRRDAAVRMASATLGRLCADLQARMG